MRLRFLIDYFLPTVLLCGFFIGCGPVAPKREFAEVAGTVTYKGEPVTVGTVLFQPPGGAAVSAPLESDGSYTLKGVVGLNKVIIISRDLPEIDPSEPPPEMPPMITNYIPEKYSTPNSPLEFHVERGSNQADFQLEGEIELLPPNAK